MHLDLPQPVLQRLEGGEVADGVGHDDAHRSLVVGLSDGLEAFLPGRVPDLQPYLLVIDFEGLDLEVYS